MNYRVLVTDYTYPDLTIEREILVPLGACVDGAQCRTVEEVAALVTDADVVITQLAPVRAKGRWCW